MKTAIVTALALLVAVSFATGASASMTPPQALTAELFAYTPHCVSLPTMRLLSGDSPTSSQYETLGVTNINTNRTYLLDDVCHGLWHWVRSNARNVSEWDVESLVVLYHEGAHASGTRSERRAECIGVVNALWTIAGRYPGLLAYNERLLLHTDERNRPPVYQLRDTCRVPAAIGKFAARGDNASIDWRGA